MQDLRRIRIVQGHFIDEAMEAQRAATRLLCDEHGAQHLTFSPEVPHHSATHVLALHS